MSFEQGMKNLNLNTIDYDIDEIKNYDLNKLNEIKIKIEFNLSDLFDKLAGVYIDVVQLRLIRTQINRLRNDHKEILDLIQNKLLDHFSNNQSNSQDNEYINIIDDNSIESNIPFAIIDEVFENGPAFNSNLRKNDKLIKFGSINVTNHSNLQKISSLVSNNIDNPIKVKILRNSSDIIDLELIPTSNWPGKGLLGCKITQI
ncbi:unnamed protein product [[Candida] boidinii]|uniref:Probable 26S proteasome regulatory subunit p27 n=1 Tax=Candida boidinii TaxID=5477 RepID=A0A9W6WI22_CANBO|nr:unnamed protein product [[Candida] boidinii]GMG04464.1 unnamed protein product [[Candida] boidinii]